MLLNVWEYRGKKPLPFILHDRQECVSFHRISIYVWHSPLQAFSCCKSKTFLFLSVNILHTHLLCVCTKEERKSWKTVYVFSCELPVGKQGKGRNSHTNGQRYLHSTVPSNHQIQKKFLVLILALLQASGNHWNLANNWKYYSPLVTDHLLLKYTFHLPVLTFLSLLPHIVRQDIKIRSSYFCDRV